MNIQDLIKIISEDDFFSINFNSDSTNVELALNTNDNMTFILRGCVSIRMKILYDSVSVKFSDKYGNIMSLIYANKKFDGSRFINWLIYAFRDFVNQSQAYVFSRRNL